MRQVLPLYTASATNLLGKIFKFWNLLLKPSVCLVMYHAKVIVPRDICSVIMFQNLDRPKVLFDCERTVCLRSVLMSTGAGSFSWNNLTRHLAYEYTNINV